MAPPIFTPEDFAITSWILQFCLSKKTRALYNGENDTTIDWDLIIQGKSFLFTWRACVTKEKKQTGKSHDFFSNKTPVFSWNYVGFLRILRCNGFFFFSSLTRILRQN